MAFIWNAIPPDLPAGDYWVRGGAEPPVLARLLEGTWFRTDGGSDGVLWFRPTEFHEVGMSHGGASTVTSTRDADRGESGEELS